MINDIILSPIGEVISDLRLRYETPRQGILAKNTWAVIRLKKGYNFEQAVKDLKGIERIWVIYQFHLNKNWKPLVTPPRNSGKKIGVFATRAPYRPNQIGLSCVKLEKINGLEIHISQSDILNGSPVIDIKPYLPYSDSFPDAKTGWVWSNLDNIYNVTFYLRAKKFADTLKKEKGINLLDYARLQLEFNPVDASRKRISRLKSEYNGKDYFALSYQDWQIQYYVDEKKRVVKVTKIIFVRRNQV